jgi:hypothetical protein
MRRDEIIPAIALALIAVLCVALLCGGETLAQDAAVDAGASESPSTQPRQQLTYWLAECQTAQLATLLAPGATWNGVTVARSRVTNRRADAILTRSGYRPAALVLHRLGVRQAGYVVVNVRGPDAIRLMMTNASAICPTVRQYSEVMALPAAVKDWIAERSTCFGEASLGAATFAEWPCRWSTDRAGEGFTVTTLSAIGPGITAGGSAASAAGFTPPEPDGGI